MIQSKNVLIDQVFMHETVDEELTPIVYFDSNNKNYNDYENNLEEISLRLPDYCKIVGADGEKSEVTERIKSIDKYYFPSVSVVFNIAVKNFSKKPFAEISHNGKTYDVYQIGRDTQNYTITMTMFACDQKIIDDNNGVPVGGYNLKNVLREEKTINCACVKGLGYFIDEDNQDVKQLAVENYPSCLIESIFLVEKGSKPDIPYFPDYSNGTLGGSRSEIVTKNYVCNLILILSKFSNITPPSEDVVSVILDDKNKMLVFADSAQRKMSYLFPDIRDKMIEESKKYNDKLDSFDQYIEYLDSFK